MQAWVLRKRSLTLRNGAQVAIAANAANRRCARWSRDVPDMDPPPAPDIAPGDPEGIKPVDEPGGRRPQRVEDLSHS